MKDIIKCYQSFLIGIYVCFIVMMMITGFIITTEFVSKTSLKTKIVYIDDKIYEVKEK
jgi:hypothetical protein